MKIMKTVVICLFLIIMISTIMTCTQSSDSDKPTKITINGVWMAEQLDNDGDGYYCNAELHFTLTSSKPNVNVFIDLGIRPGSNNPDDPYQLCFRSANIQIDETKTGEWYVPLHLIDAALTAGYYDFQLKVFLTTDAINPAVMATLTSDPELGHFPMEEVANDPVEEWISWLDDNVFESAFTYYPRRPTGAYYSTLAEKFVKPSAAEVFTMKKVRVHIPTLYQTSPSMVVSVWAVGTVTRLVDINQTLSTGWNEFDLEYDLSNLDTFYVGVSTSIEYAVSVDSNSTTLNGYALWYTSGNPPTYTWMKQERNFAIEFFASYTLNLNLSVMERVVHSQSAGNRLRPGIPLK